MQEVPVTPELTRLLLVAAVMLAATAVGIVATRRDGRVVAVASDRSTNVLDLNGQGRPRAILFGSASCAPCDTVKTLLREVASEQPDFAWTYVDAAARLDLADAHRVRRVPTLLVLDPDGTVVARTSGVPARDALRAALATPALATPSLATLSLATRRAS
jgi:thiol-disulfide isomerase/thioredoxin